MCKIALGDFVRNTFLKANPQFSEHDLLTRVAGVMADLNAQQGAIELRKESARKRIRHGYREGVILVSLRDVSGFKRRVRDLVEGDYLFGKYVPRVEGEVPRKKVAALTVGEVPDATHVDAVLYHRDVLNETDPQKRDYDYEIVTFLAKDCEGDEPMETEVLLHNHFQSDGGSNTLMSDSEFVAKLRESFLYWKGKAFISPE